MNTLRYSLLIAALIVAVIASSNGQDKSRKTLLSVLKEGQIVSVKEVFGRYEITVIKNAPVGSKVIEVGTDFVILEDPAGVMETSIHVTSIKSIIRLKLP